MWRSRVLQRQCDALCYLCWHGVFSCASVSFPVSELCTHCPHNERNVVSECLPAPASSHTQYVIIGFLYIHATRVLLYFPLRTKMEITRVTEISGAIKCALKNDLQYSESRFVCLIQQSASWQDESRSLVNRFLDFYKTCKFIAMFTKVRHCILTCTTTVQSALSHTTSLTANVILI